MVQFRPPCANASLIEGFCQFLLSTVQQTMATDTPIILYAWENIQNINRHNPFTFIIYIYQFTIKQRSFCKDITSLRLNDCSSLHLFQKVGAWGSMSVFRPIVVLFVFRLFLWLQVAVEPFVLSTLYLFHHTVCDYMRSIAMRKRTICGPNIVGYYNSAMFVWPYLVPPMSSFRASGKMLCDCGLS